MTPRSAVALAGGLAAGLTVLLGFIAPDSIAEDPPELSLVALTPEVGVGSAERIEVQFLDPAGDPIVSSVTVTSERLDMGPDGMPTMAAPIQEVPSDRPGVIAFEAEIVMAGRWALSIEAQLEGMTEPVSGVVEIVAVETASQATPPEAYVAHREVLYYRHPMGLPDISPVPKKDSMGMDYIPVYADEASGTAGTVTLSPAKIQRAGVRTTPVERAAIVDLVRGAGTVTVDESRLTVLTTKYDGFIEELFVAREGQRVERGEPLARVWIESPDILRKQADYLGALGVSEGDAEAAANNLRHFGIPEDVIAELRRSGNPVRSIVITAAASGIVLEKPAVEGMRFAAGTVLFRIADLSTVWVVARVAERELTSLETGQTVVLRPRDDGQSALQARIDFIHPDVDLATRTGRVRIVVPNAEGDLRVGQFVDVTIETVTPEAALVVPASAVLDSGTRVIAFVAGDDGVFAPRDLVLGRQGGGMIEVREGLALGELVVVSGNFLLDAESNLNAALMAIAASSPTP